MSMGLLRYCGLGVLLVGAASAQPTLGVANSNGPCASGPVLIGGQPDTVGLPVDGEGFTPMFDGKTLKGWWEGCGGSHATDKVNGGTWLADSTNQAIYSMQNSNGSGSVLTTNKSYTHYEMIFDFWSTFGNDAGVFNRTPANWTCYQTTLDYINGSSVGGAYGENNFANHNIDYYTFNGGGGANITITTGARSWTTLTSLHNPTSFGCPSTGCTGSNWTTVWSTTGWNQIRIKFYGGLTANTYTKMKAWVRKASDSPTPWVPTYDDSLLRASGNPANPIGLQIHQGSDRWPQSGNKGAWYRNLRIRPLDVNGEPLTVSLRGATPSAAGVGFRVAAGMLSGNVVEAHRIVIRDVQGKVLARYAGEGGEVRYPLPSTPGMLLVDVRTSHGVDRFRVNPL